MSGNPWLSEDFSRTRCVCTHPRGLHKNGVCMAVVNPCGCQSYEPPDIADRAGCGPVVSDKYHGVYAKRYTYEG